MVKQTSTLRTRHDNLKIAGVHAVLLPAFVNRVVTKDARADAQGRWTQIRLCQVRDGSNFGQWAVDLRSWLVNNWIRPAPISSQHREH
jgi:hypothetical protein